MIFVSLWQISDNLMFLKIYVCDAVFNIFLAPFYFLILKISLVLGLELNKIYSYTCWHILRSYPLFAGHFYLWMNVPRVTYMKNWGRRVVATGHRSLSTHHLSLTKTMKKSQTSFSAFYQIRVCWKLIPKGGKRLIQNSGTHS
jgi:hypothetical protein